MIKLIKLISNNAAKNVNNLATNLSILHNYFDRFTKLNLIVQTKLFSNLYLYVITFLIFQQNHSFHAELINYVYTFIIIIIILLYFYIIIFFICK